MIGSESKTCESPRLCSGGASSRQNHSHQHRSVRLTTNDHYSPELVTCQTSEDLLTYRGANILIGIACAADMAGSERLNRLSS